MKKQVKIATVICCILAFSMILGAYANASTTLSTNTDCTQGGDHNWGSVEPWKPAPELYPYIWMVYCQNVGCSAETRRDHLGGNCANGHNYVVIQSTAPTCWTGGGDLVECLRCGFDDLINWQPKLGHQFGPPQPIPGNTDWMIIYCERIGCGHSEYVPAVRR